MIILSGASHKRQLPRSQGLYNYAVLGAHQPEPTRSLSFLTLTLAVIGVSRVRHARPTSLSRSLVRCVMRIHLDRIYVFK